MDRRTIRARVRTLLRLAQQLEEDLSKPGEQQQMYVGPVACIRAFAQAIETDIINRRYQRLRNKQTTYAIGGGSGVDIYSG